MSTREKYLYPLRSLYVLHYSLLFFFLIDLVIPFSDYLFISLLIHFSI